MQTSYRAKAEWCFIRDGARKRGREAGGDVGLDGGSGVGVGVGGYKTEEDSWEGVGQTARVMLTVNTPNAWKTRPLCSKVHVVRLLAFW